MCVDRYNWSLWVKYVVHIKINYFACNPMLPMCIVGKSDQFTECIAENMICLFIRCMYMLQYNHGPHTLQLFVVKYFELMCIHVCMCMCLCRWWWESLTVMMSTPSGPTHSPWTQSAARGCSLAPGRAAKLLDRSEGIQHQYQRDRERKILKS